MGYGLLQTDAIIPFYSKKRLSKTKILEAFKKADALISLAEIFLRR